MRYAIDEAAQDARTDSQRWQGIRFSDFVRLVEAFGFRLSRVQGSHHIFSRANITELVNIQDVHGEAKPYQIRQFLSLVEKYNLRLVDDQP